MVYDRSVIDAALDITAEVRQRRPASNGGGGHRADNVPECFWKSVRLNAKGGVVVFEPMGGGMCSGLDMALRSGLRVTKYVYCDTDAEMRKIAKFRVNALSKAYPTLFPPSSHASAFDAVPQDVYAVTEDDLLKVGAADPEVAAWLTVCGWQCQDLSPAGRREGLNGSRSKTFFPLVRMLDAIARIRRERRLCPPVYIVENTAFQTYCTGSVEGDVAVYRDFTAVCAVLGRPVVVDAARFGSGAHRLRNFWSDLFSDVSSMQGLLDRVKRPDDAPNAQDLLDPGRTVRISNADDNFPFYPVNQIGYPVRVFPTFVQKVKSWNFTPGQNGAVTVVFNKTLDTLIESYPIYAQHCKSSSCGQNENNTVQTHRRAS